MEKNKKSLLVITIIMLLLNNLCFSQNNTTTNTQTAAEFESNTSYFNDSVNSDTSNTSFQSTSTTKVVIKMIVVLVLVVAALYAMMHFFKKKNNVTKSDDDFLRRVSSLNLSPGKSVEIVTLVDRGFILGVTDSNINLIAEIDDKEMISALNLNFDKKQNVKKPMNFSDVLDMFMPNGPRNNKNIFNNSENTISTKENNKTE